MAATGVASSLTYRHMLVTMTKKKPTETSALYKLRQQIDTFIRKLFGKPPRVIPPLPSDDGGR